MVQQSINSELLARLQKTLDIGPSRVYALIDQKVRSTHLPRPLAAIALASERGINISRFATPEDLAIIRQAPVNLLPAPVVLPSPPEPRRQMKPASRAARQARRSPPPRRGTRVFVVHGRNTRLRDSMFDFLRAVGLQPLEWLQAIRMTGQASPYVGTILETAFREAAAVVVLLTPDDEARLKPEFRVSRDPTYEKSLTGQSRPNVLFEAGMAFGRDPNSTILVQVGEIRPFSDVAGRHLLHMTSEAASRHELVTKLANAGCNVDTSGSGWLTAGDFSL